jgi:phospholipase C
MRRIALALLLAVVAGCGGADSAVEDPQDLAATTSAIRHLIVVVQENHSFDSYFGTYCTAPAGSAPSCTTGAVCCEAAPDLDPGSGASPVRLTDAQNGDYSPDHTQACESAEVDSGAMDAFVSAPCGSAQNFSLASATDVPNYRAWAKRYAVADRYFQPILGASSSNDMYLWTARYVFTDNAWEPEAIGASCQGGDRTQFTTPNVGDLLSARKVSWAWYIEGYAAARASNPGCMAAPADCPANDSGYPCTYDPGDIPAAYFAPSADDPVHMRDLAQLHRDLAAGTLPSVVFIKGLGYHTEHPGSGTTISAGEQFVGSIFSALQGSVHARTTLMLVTWDESGGYFDHVAPPPVSAVDGQPYGPRVPLLALGPFARTNHVSHATMEHSSIVRFIEWNWLRKTGQLQARDAVVNNIGSLLDPRATGVAVPAN